MAALGDVDELNASIGLVIAMQADQNITQLLRQIQHELFELGADLATPDRTGIQAEQISRLEMQLEHYNRNLPPLLEFVLPGANPASAFAHQARAICRRAERSLWHLSRDETINSNDPVYLNRLSDLLFVLARCLSRTDSEDEPTWNRTT